MREKSELVVVNEYSAPGVLDFRGVRSRVSRLVGRGDLPSRQLRNSLCKIQSECKLLKRKNRGNDTAAPGAWFFSPLERKHGKAWEAQQ